MALQGMGLTVNDIDIQTDKDGAYEIERRLSEYVLEPVRFVESTKMRSHLGLLQMDGIKVEIMGDIQKLAADQTWEAPVQVELHKRWVELDDLPIPVLSLEYEYEAYRMMGRADKAKLIQKWLEQHPSE